MKKEKIGLLFFIAALLPFIYSLFYAQEIWQYVVSSLFIGISLVLIARTLSKDSKKDSKKSKPIRKSLFR